MRHDQIEGFTVQRVPGIALDDAHAISHSIQQRVETREMHASRYEVGGDGGSGAPEHGKQRSHAGASTQLEHICARHVRNGVEKMSRQLIDRAEHEVLRLDAVRFRRQRHSVRHEPEASDWTEKDRRHHLRCCVWSRIQQPEVDAGSVHVVADESLHQFGRQTLTVDEQPNEGGVGILD